MALDHTSHFVAQKHSSGELWGGSFPTYRQALGLGAALLLAFLPPRYYNGFGNIGKWQGSAHLAFLNVVKYPPSATFILLTMCLNLFLLAMLARVAGRRRPLLEPFVALGRVPLFFYITHLFLYAAMGHLLVPHGTTISGMYRYWLLGLVMPYPMCLWYGHLKSRQPPGSPLHPL